MWSTIAGRSGMGTVEVATIILKGPMMRVMTKKGKRDVMS